MIFRTFIHESGGAQAVGVAELLVGALRVAGFGEARERHLQPAEGAGAAVLLSRGRTDLRSHAVQRLTHTNTHKHA